MTIDIEAIFGLVAIVFFLAFTFIVLAIIGKSAKAEGKEKEKDFKFSMLFVLVFMIAPPIALFWVGVQVIKTLSKGKVVGDDYDYSGVNKDMLDLEHIHSSFSNEQGDYCGVGKDLLDFNPTFADACRKEADYSGIDKNLL